MGHCSGIDGIGISVATDDFLNNLNSCCKCVCVGDLPSKTENIYGQMKPERRQSIGMIAYLNNVLVVFWIWTAIVRCSIGWCFDLKTVCRFLRPEQVYECFL